MNNYIKIALIVFMVSFTGCATAGRFRLVDIDLRDRDQIVAYENEAKIVYTSDKTETVSDQPVSATPFDWTMLFDFLKVVKGRISIFFVEWKCEEKK